MREREEKMFNIILVLWNSLPLLLSLLLMFFVLCAEEEVEKPTPEWQASEWGFPKKAHCINNEPNMNGERKKREAKNYFLSVLFPTLFIVSPVVRFNKKKEMFV